MYEKKHELIKGGCGRDEESLKSDAMNLVILLISIVIIGIAIILEKIFYGQL